jgi:CARDB
MLPFLLAAAMVAAQPSPCPNDLLVANPRIKIVRAHDRAYDNNILTVDVRNNGTAPQREEIRQHLDLLLGSTLVGTQPIPALGSQDSYEAAFRFQRKHEKKHVPQPMTFRLVIDSKISPAENCSASNDKLTATL